MSRKELVASRSNTWNLRLSKRLHWSWLLFGWIGATLLFFAIVWLSGGPTANDSDVTVFTAWSLAHGHLACAYLPSGILGYPPTAPLYPIFSGAMSAILQIGHGIPFPTSAQLGNHCVTATAAINHWILHSDAVVPTLRIGYVGWLVLAVGFISLVRASGRGRCGWEIVGLFLLACLPPVSMCLAEYFHPQDLIAVGFTLVALACVLRTEWTGAGVWFGLAVSTQQFAILPLVALFAMTPRNRLPQLIVGAIVAAAVIDIPLAFLSSGRAIVGILVGTGASSYYNTILDLSPFHGSSLYAISRVAPIILALALGWWASDRLGSKVFEPVPLISVITTALALRLVFEVNFWGYYMMGVAVMLAALDIARRRIRIQFLLWLLATVSVSLLGGLSSPGRISSFPVWTWQVVFVAGALALAISPLVSLTRKQTKAPSLTAPYLR
jgi:hypothetical protein